MSVFITGEQAAKALHSVANELLLPGRIANISLSVSAGELAKVTVEYLLDADQLNTALDAIRSESSQRAQHKPRQWNSVDAVIDGDIPVSILTTRVCDAIQY